MSLNCPNCQFEKTTIKNNFLQCDNCNETMEKLPDGGWRVLDKKSEMETIETPPIQEISAEPKEKPIKEILTEIFADERNNEALPVRKSNNLLFGSLLVVGISLIFLGKFLCLIKKKQFSKAPSQGR